jgi:hypothetical protein
MYGLTRATTTLVFAGVAGLLIWIATQLSNETLGGYWARIGLVAGAGFVMALSQLLGGWTKWGWPRLSVPVFLTAFVPVAIVSLWIIIAAEPSSTWINNHVEEWTRDIRVTGLVTDLINYIPVLAFGSGLVLGFSLDTTGPRRYVGEPEPTTTTRRRGLFRRRETVPTTTATTTDGRVADEPLTAERERVATERPDDRETVPTTTTRRTDEDR